MNHDDNQTVPNVSSNRPFPFLELPSELKSIVYDLLIPSNYELIDITLNTRHPWLASANERTQGLLGEVGGQRDQQHVPSHHPVDIIKAREAIQLVLSLMQSCRTCHRELGPRIYDSLSFKAYEAVVAVQFAASRHSMMKPHIQKFDIVNEGYPRHGEKREKELIKSIIEGLPELRAMRWYAVDGSAEVSEKGTRWKPQILRKLALALQTSKHMSKVLYIPSPPGREHFIVTVRLVTDQDVAKQNEVELDVAGEYNNWLNKNKERREQKSAGTGN